MEQREYSIFGRKIFFLNMPFTFIKTVISKLREEEYEAFVIKNYKNAKNILCKNPGSLFFVNISGTNDNNLTVKQWFNFFQSFSEDPQLKTIFIGIIAGFITEAEKNFFLTSNSIPGGFSSLSQSTEVLLKQIENILETNSAKGRRKYVRAKIPPNKKVFITINDFEKKVKLPVIDMSSVGIAVAVNSEIKDKFIKNNILNNIQINFEDTELKADAVIFCTHEISDTLHSVILLLTKNTPYIVKDSIRKYVFSLLDQEIIESIIDMKQDENSYSAAGEENDDYDEILNDLPHSADSPSNLKHITSEHINIQKGKKRNITKDNLNKFIMTE